MNENFTNSYGGLSFLCFGFPGPPLSLIAKTTRYEWQSYQLITLKVRFGMLVVSCENNSLLHHTCCTEGPSFKIVDFM